MTSGLLQSRRSIELSPSIRAALGSVGMVTFILAGWLAMSGLGRAHYPFVAGASVIAFMLAVGFPEGRRPRHGEWP